MPILLFAIPAAPERAGTNQAARNLLLAGDLENAEPKGPELAQESLEFFAV